MSYQIVYPYPAVMTIDAESFKDAVKSYAKLNYNYAINSLIIKKNILIFFIFFC
jgi:hypothetical protein